VTVIDVILPALDEAAAMPGLLHAMPSGCRAIVVDNDSTDGTGDVAAAHWATVVNRGPALEMSRRTEVNLHDLGPMRAAPRQRLLDLGIADRRFGWPLEMLRRASRDGWRIAEVDVPYHPPVGRSKVTGTVICTLRTMRDMGRVLAS